jgi:protein-disulfide isomerase
MTKEVKMVLGVVAVVIVFAGIGFFLLKQQNDSLPKISTDQSEALSRSTPNIRGKADSTIKVIEFGDIQCPACAAVNPLMDELYKQYGDRVSFTFRHFPLPMHKNAYAGSDAAEAAGEQGKFWEMVTKLYEVQPIWAETSDPSPTYEKLAQELGLNMDQFSKAYNSKAYRRRIDQDKADGQYLGVNGTPTFYVNGEQIMSGGPAQVKSKIEELLKTDNGQTPPATPSN